MSLDSTVVADVADTQVECNCVGIKPGRTYTARQLLDGLLLVSGNDAANTLAHMLGGPDATVAKMNAKAASLGATNTHAATPSGLDGPGGSGASTAHDLAVIFRAAMANPMFAQITAEPSAMFPGDHGDQPILNQDELLQRYPGAIGGKTGFTNAARKTFVGAAARGGRRLVIAMMYGLVKQGGPTYWDQAGELVRLGFRAQPAVQHRLAVIAARSPIRQHPGDQRRQQRNSLLLDIRFRQQSLAPSRLRRTRSSTTPPEPETSPPGSPRRPGSARAASWIFAVYCPSTSRR